MHNFLHTRVYGYYLLVFLFSSSLVFFTLYPVQASVSDEVSFEKSLQSIKVALGTRVPNCIISYGWENDLHHPNHAFVNRLCDDLKKAGINAIIDVNDLITGERITDFTSNIRKPDYFVIVVYSPTFKSRAAKEKTWLHHEVGLMKERFDEGDSFFYVPLLIAGDMDVSIPDDLEPAERLYKDFRSADAYNNNVLEILKEKILRPEKVIFTTSEKICTTNHRNWGEPVKPSLVFFVPEFKGTLLLKVVSQNTKKVILHMCGKL
jgi:hypothetical protein